MNPGPCSLFFAARLRVFATLVVCSIGATVYAQTPVIFTSTKAALPGDMVVIQGAYFIQGTNQPQVWLDQITGSTDTPNPEIQATEIISSSEKLLHVRIPSALPTGLYALFVKCGTYTSSPVWINRAESWQVLDLAGTQVDPNRTFRVSGWNMDLPGATPQVWFKNTATNVRTAATVTNVDRTNFVTLTAPASIVPGQSYQLIISNGYGGTQGETDGPVLSCIATPVDALNLGVPWADDFAFAATNVYNVKTDSRLTLHAVGDGVTDDQPAIIAACNMATTAGGGCVYLPAGTYKLGTALRPKQRVVIRGAGKDLTTLLGGIAPFYVHATQGTMFYNGTLDLTIATGNLSWGTGQANGGPAIVARVRISDGGLSVSSGKLKTLVKDSEFISTAGAFASTHMNNLLLKNCHLQWQKGRITAWSGTNLQLDGCEFTRFDAAAPYAGVGFGGWTLSSCDNVALIDCVFDKSSVGPIIQHNDGETILNEGIPRLGAGHPTAVTSTTLTDTARAWTANQLTDAEAYVVIVSGTGEGQWRKIISHTADTVTLDSAWTITPDTASGYAVTWKDEHWLIAGNIFQDCPRATWLYGAPMTDIAIMDNSYINSADLYLRADQRLNDGQGRFNLFRDVLIQNNEMLNTNQVYPAQLSCQAVTAITGETPLGSAFWDVVVRGNSINAMRPSMTANNAYGIAGEGYFAIGTGGGNINGGQGIRGVLFDRNQAYDLDYAFHVATGSYQTTIWRPIVDNVGILVEDKILTGYTQASVQTVVIPEDEIVDNADATGITITGSWTLSTTGGGYYGPNLLHDNNTGKGSKSVRFTPTLTVPGTYAVYARWLASTNRADNVPIAITHNSGTANVVVNQKLNSNTWVLLGTYAFNTGTGGYVTISNTGTNGYVVADAVKFVKQ